MWGSPMRQIAARLSTARVRGRAAPRRRRFNERLVSRLGTIQPNTAHEEEDSAALSISRSLGVVSLT